jgi:hypothetical protein
MSECFFERLGKRYSQLTIVFILPKDLKKKIIFLQQNLFVSLQILPKKNPKSLGWWHQEDIVLFVIYFRQRDKLDGTWEGIKRR